jgi:uncharacterized protein
MAVEVGYLTIGVKDVARAKVFYGKLFGWDVAVTPMGGHVANTKLPIGLAASGPARVPFIYFKVEDIEGTLKRLGELGGKIISRSDTPSGQMAECADDQETVFSVWQPAPGFA